MLGPNVCYHFDFTALRFASLHGFICIFLLKENSLPSSVTHFMSKVIFMSNIFEFSMYTDVVAYSAVATVSE